MLSPAINALSISISNHHSDAAKNTLSRLVYTFCKTRGYKVISRFFPHSIPDLVLVINASQSFTEGVAWEFRYVVLLWLSIAIKIPFDLGKILPGQDVAAQLQDLCTSYFFHPGKEREGAVLVLSRAFMRWVLSNSSDLLTQYFLRQDMRPYLSGFVGWCSEQLSSHEQNTFIVGVYACDHFHLTHLQGTLNPPILLRNPQSQPRHYNSQSSIANRSSFSAHSRQKQL